MVSGILADVPNGDVIQGAADAWDSAFEFLRVQGLSLVLNLIAALAIFVVGKWVVRLLLRLIRAALGRARIDETLTTFLANIAHALLMVFVIMAAIERVGIDTTSFAAVVAALGLAIGLALQSSLSNFAAGVMLILFKPFAVGNFVEAGGTSGTVEAIHIFSTILRTGDNVQIVVPNGEITQAAITNFSARETRRVDLVVGCGYDDDLRSVKSFLEELLADEERILADPEPVVAVSELGDSSVNFVVRPWVKSEDYWAVRWELNERIKLGFDENGFTIPYPTRDVHVHNAVT